MNDMKSENKKEKRQSVKGAIAEGALELLVELLMALLAFGLGMLVLSAYPRERLMNLDGEIILAIGMALLAIPVGIGFVIAYIIAKKRGRKKVNVVYKALKKKYELTTVTLTRKMHGEYTDVYILRGKGSRGGFELYRDGLDLVFLSDGEKEKRLDTPEDAIAEIERFMYPA